MKHFIPDQSGFKCVHELDCPELPKIQQEVLDWIDKNTKFLSEKLDRMFWKQIDYKDMGRAVPSLLKFMHKIHIPIRQITVGLLTEAMKDTGFVLHHGAPPLNFKINFPILNTEDVWTEWYRIPSADLQTLSLVENKHTNTEEYNLRGLHSVVSAKYPCALKYNMHKNPIIFNSLIPHRVMPGPNAKFPRIMLATMPIIDPVELMTI